MSAIESIVGRMMSQSSVPVRMALQNESAQYIPQLNLRFSFRRV